MPQADWSTLSLLAQFRPEPGWTLDRACFASYSADIRVVAAVLLSLRGAADDPERGTTVQFAQALRDLRGRVAVVLQRGRLHWPRSLPQVGGLLDRFVFEAAYGERGPSGRSWHPKFAVMRWQRHASQETAWRIWLGSRNLTRDLSLDAGLLLAEADEKMAGSAAPAIAEAVQSLQSHLPERLPRFTSTDLQQLAMVRWALPAGTKELVIHWLDGTKDRFPTVDGKHDEILVVSPFVDADAMHRTLPWAKPKVRPVIVASAAELNRECPAGSALNRTLDLRACGVAPEEGLAYEPPPGGAGDVDSSEGAEQETDRSDEAGIVHAKLMYLRQGREKRLWLGSPNLTGRAWSRNVEIVAELISTAARDPWGPILWKLADSATQHEPAEQADVEEDEKDRLEELRKRLAAVVMHQRRNADEVTVVAEEPFYPDDAEISLRVGPPWSGFELVAWPEGANEISLGNVPLAACSDLLLFVVKCGEAELGWLMRAPFLPALGDARDQAGLSLYLGLRGYLSLIQAELEPAGALAGPAWDWVSRDPGRGGGGKWGANNAPTLEGLLRLFLRQPDRFRVLARTVEMLKADAERWETDESSEDVRRELAAFQELWHRVGERLNAQVKGGA